MPDEMMAAIAAALAGDRLRARREFAELWDRIGPDGDPLHRATLAHFMADVQDDPHDELEWDRRALLAADELTDERAREYDPALTVRGLYASLHASLAIDHEKLGDHPRARDHLTLAEAATADLPTGPYGDLVRSEIAALRERLTPPA